MITARWLLVSFLLSAGSVFSSDLNMDWVYHDDGDGTDDRTTENVPGEGFAFLGNGTVNISDSEPVTLYVITGNQFAGDAEEQVFIRWWNGEKENWIMGEWVKNIYLGPGDTETGRFHGKPEDGSAMLDLWKFTVPAEVTMPGENYYIIQLKGLKDDQASTAYLLRDSVGEFSKENNVGQQWTTSEEYQGHDWSVTIR
ncbi:MAG: hypothetical protein V2A34_10815 [Lentisphaerota bacterium]